MTKTVSLWSYLNRPEILRTFLNPFYEPNSSVLWPSVAAPSIVSDSTSPHRTSSIVLFRFFGAVCTFVSTRIKFLNVRLGKNIWPSKAKRSNFAPTWTNSDKNYSNSNGNVRKKLIRWRRRWKTRKTPLARYRSAATERMTCLPAPLCPESRSFSISFV